MIFLYSVYSTLVSSEHFRTYLYKKGIFVAFYKCVTIFEDKIINSKTLEHAALVFTERWALANKIMLNIMQNFKFDFLKNEFWADLGVRFKFHFQNLT